jgi:hypothetical protein
MIFRTIFSFVSAALLAALCLVAGPAGAQDTLYTVSGVHVDATGASSGEALNEAIAQGRAKAFQILFRRLARQADWGRQPALDGPSLLRLSRGTDISNVRRSTTRYVADVTYMFNPAAVQRALRASQIAFSQVQAKPILVIPMSPGVGQGPWAQALMSPAFHDGQVPFAVLAPEDEASLSALNFDAAGWNDVSAVAAKNHVGEVALVQVVSAGGKMTVNVRRLGPVEQPAKSSVDVPLQQTVGTTYPVAAQAAVRTIEDMWKTRSAIDFSQRGKLTADVRIASLAQWGEIQTSLAEVGNVTSMNVTAMDIDYARVNLTYQGGLEQLREAFMGAGLTLTNHGGQWTLAKAQ